MIAARRAVTCEWRDQGIITGGAIRSVEGEGSP